MPELSRRNGVLQQEAAEVYLLLDFLSGRADRSIDDASLLALRGQAAKPFTPAEQAAQQGASEGQDPPPALSGGERQGQLADAVTTADLSNPVRLIRRAMRLKYPVIEADDSFEDDAAFLIRARDLLNRAASPATGTSIAFTLMVITRWRSYSSTWANWWHAVTSLFGAGNPAPAAPSDPKGGLAEEAAPRLVPAAEALVRSTNIHAKTCVLVLIFAILLSAYAAWGKQVLDGIADLRREFNDVQVAIERVEAALAQAPPASAAGTAGEHPSVPRYCQRPASPGAQAPARAAMPQRFESTTQYHLCDRLDDINRRFETAYANLRAWSAVRLGLFSKPSERPDCMVPPARAEADVLPHGERMESRSCRPRPSEGEQWASALLSTIGTYVLPVCYGYLGALIFLLRRFLDRLWSGQLSVHDRQNNNIRSILGAALGACIGLFFSGKASPAETAELAAVPLSASALAFLAGYSVEAVFRALELLLARVFPGNAPEAAAAPPRKLPTS